MTLQEAVDACCSTELELKLEVLGYLIDTETGEMIVVRKGLHYENKVKKFCALNQNIIYITKFNEKLKKKDEDE